MSTHFSTDIENDHGNMKYHINFVTDDNSHFRALQEVARQCVDHKVNKATEVTQVAVPYVDFDKLAGGRYSCVYRCSHCDSRINDHQNMFYVHCPHCGYKIDYSCHEELRSGKNVFR